MKILENKGIETTGLSATAINKLITAGKSGIVGRYLNECALSTTGNTVIISAGKMIIGGVQLEIDTPVSLTLSSVPTEDVRYQVVVELRKGEDEQWVDDIFVRLPSTLIQENFTQGGYTYQLELGRVTHTSTGQVTNAARTAEILYGGGGNGAEIEVGEVTTAMIDTNLPAEVNINKVLDDGKIKLNFGFLLPKPYEENVTSLVYAVNATGETVSIPNTDSGFVDKLELLGNTTGGGGTPETPIAIQSVTSPVSINVTGKNLFNPSISTLTDSGVTITYNSANGYFTLNGTAQSSKIVPLGKSTNLPFKDKTITMSIHNVSSSGTVQNFTVGGRYVGGGNFVLDYPLSNKTFTLASDIDYWILYFTAGRVFNNQQFRVQAEFGSVKTEYEAYQGETLSIPLKDTNDNPFEIHSTENIRDRIYLESGKAYLQKKCKSTTSNVTDALPNSAYIGTQGNGTSSGQNITVSGTVVYQLANPEIIELHPSVYEAIKSIPTKEGQTNLWATGANGVSAWLDVTEMQMAGNKIDALLKNTNGDSVLPITTADNVLMPDGTTAEDAIRNGFASLGVDIDNINNSSSENINTAFSMINDILSRVNALEANASLTVSVIKDLNIQSVSGGTTALAGTTVTLTALRNDPTPTHYYRFDRWTKNGEQISTANPFTFTLSEETAGTYKAEGSKHVGTGGGTV